MHLQFSEHELKNDGMVTLAVTIEEELLRRMDATVQPDLAAEDTTGDRVEVVEDQNPGELHYNYKANKLKTFDFTDE